MRSRKAHQIDMLPSAADFCVPAYPPAPAPHHLRPRLPRNRPVLEHQQRRHRQGPSTRDLGTGGTVSAQTMGEVDAEMRAERGSHMPAELPRQTAPIHHCSSISLFYK